MINLEKTKKIIVFYIAVSLFLSLSFFLVLKKETYWFFALPLVLVVVYYYMISLDKVLLLITFLTPLAVTLKDSALDSALSLPTEPMMFGVVVVFLGSLLLGGNYNRKASTHIISYLIYFNLLWMLITSFSSEIPLVSFKHLLSRIWFVVPFYFATIPMFRIKKNIHRFIWLYILGLTIVIVYTLIRHASYGFSEDSSHWVMTPFYNDHTAYGAALAMFLPILAGYVFYPKFPFWKRMAALSFFALFAVAIIFSYSRAAWLSMVVVSLVLALVLLHIRFKWVVGGMVFSLILLFVFQQQIFNRLEKSNQVSSNSFVEHIRSISNISSNTSNLERLNRWASAIRMFEQRPWVGWGPGTYQFVYAPFQLARERTVISTNFGDRGNAHSEYLGPLSEEGVFGLISVLLLFGFAIKTGFKLYRKGSREIKFLSLMVTLGLVTYFFHGFLNDFLDTDKLSVPVWGFIAILVSLDIYHLKEGE